MIIKLADQIRKWKKDNNNKELDWSNLEILAQQYDAQNKIEWEKINIKKESSKLENQKLQLEIEKLKKEEKLFCTKKGTCFQLSTLKTLCEYDNNYHRLSFNDSKLFLYVDSEEADEIIKLLQ